MSILKNNYKKILVILLLLVIVILCLPYISIMIEIIFNLGRYLGYKARLISAGFC